MTISYWQDSVSVPLTKYPSLNEDIEVDVVIVGAGIAGLTAAYVLKQSGRTVAVLEKNTIGSGTTSKTTGKVTSQHNVS
jgi:glycine/D-amino acid oxidase-like deaminating enzyme